MKVEAPNGVAVLPFAVSAFARCGEAQPGPAIAVARIGLIGLDAHQNEPASAQNNGPSKCAGLNAARSPAAPG
jgi:hypothetical protein